MRPADKRVIGAALLDDVTDQVLLAVVGGEYRDLIGGIAKKAHVHEHRHHILRFRQVLQVRQCITSSVPVSKSTMYEIFNLNSTKIVVQNVPLYNIVNTYWLSHARETSQTSTVLLQHCTW